MRKNWRRILSAVLTFVIMFTMCEFPAVKAEEEGDNGYQLILSEDFEGETYKFNGRGIGMQISSDKAKTGSKSAYATGRTEDWHGINKNVTSELLGGNTYEFSAWVYTEEACKMVLSLSCAPESGATTWPWIDSKDVAPREWTKLSGQFMIPKGLKSLEFNIQTNNENDNEKKDFYVDDIEVYLVAAKEAEVDKSLTPLKDIYKNDFLIGSIYTPSYLDGLDKEILLHHYNVVTPENLMKPEEMQKEKGKFEFEKADTMVAFCEENNLPIIGHVFQWHKQTPSWMAEDLLDEDGKVPEGKEEEVRAEAVENLQTHIETIGKRYAGKISAWDVVNEAIADNVNLPADGDWRKCLRNTPWKTAIGDDYIELAFKFAKKADPYATLYYNDYNLNVPAKAEIVAKMVQDLRSQGIPIEGIGMQGHYNLNTPMANVEDSIKLFKAIDGVKISITELDVPVSADSAAGLTKEQEIRQAQVYAQLFQIFKKHSDSIERVTFWGCNDAESWRDYPCLFHGDYSAKEAYYAVANPDDYLEKHPVPEIPEANQLKAMQGTPDIDGTVDEIWNETETAKVDIVLAAWSAATATVKALWDEENVYVLMDVTDGKLDASNSEVYLQDSVEVFISETNHKTPAYQTGDGQYRVSFEGKESFGGYAESEGFESETKITNKGYLVEMKIPVSSIEMAKDTVLGFEAQVNDCEGGERVNIAKFNDPTDASWESTALWGELKLVGEAEELGRITEDFEGENHTAISKKYQQEEVRHIKEPGTGANGSDGYGALVNRTHEYCGIMFNLDEFIGKKVKVNTWLKSNAPNATIRCNLLLVVSGGESYPRVFEAAGVKNTEWTNFSGTAEIPEYVDKAYVYFETTDSTMSTIDIYLDDLVVTAYPSELQYADTTGYKSLKELYEDYFKVGMAATNGMMRSTAHGPLIASQFNSISHENECKPENFFDVEKNLSDPERYNEAPALKFDSIEAGLKFAQNNNMVVRGHVLIWHDQTPNWLFYENYDPVKGKLASPELMLKRMEHYIKGVLEWTQKNYPGVITAWEVCNEAVTESGDLRTDVDWYKTVGPDYVTKAFEFARKYAAKDVKLFYNDFNEYVPSKQNGILNVLSDAKKAGNIDGIGMQSHINFNQNVDSYMAALRKYAEAGYEIQVTELDITIDAYNPTDANLMKQANLYRSLFEGYVQAVKDGINLSSVTIWGISDDQSWRSWGYPVLFNSDLSAKPAFHALVELGEGALADVIDGLKTELGNQVSQAKAIRLNAYSSADAATVTAAISNAEAAIGNKAVTKQDLLKVTADLKNAVAKLTKVDAARKTLQDLIKTSEAKKNVGYTDDSWKAFTKAIADAKNVADGRSTEDELKKAATALQNADKNLKLKPAPTTTYRITYRLNGGKNHKSNPATYKTDTVTLKNPTRAKYVFKGWYTDSKFKNKITRVSGKNITVYAKWEKVSVKRARISSLKNPKSRQMAVKLARVSGAKGYEISYSTSSKFTKKTTKTRTTTKLNSTITKLKKGQRYYVRARAYKLDSTGKKVYGKYSPVRNIILRK